MQKIYADSVQFIKLGKKGSWEKECIENGTLKLSYQKLSHKACLEQCIDELKKAYGSSANSGVVQRHINQVMKFYHEPKTTLWITFYADRLWWCFADEHVQQLPDNVKQRKTLEGFEWSDTDINGELLLKSRLSGKLLAVQGFQGTICEVQKKEYLLHKINGTNEPHVDEAKQSLIKLKESLEPIIRDLHFKDLETLVDLIFRQGGWQRTGVSGGVEKDIDLDIESPITRERAAVQVKSTAAMGDYKKYCEKFSATKSFDRFYFVVHSPKGELKKFVGCRDEKFIVWGVKELAEQSISNGLCDWLIRKA